MKQHEWKAKTPFSAKLSASKIAWDALNKSQQTAWIKRCYMEQQGGKPSGTATEDKGIGDNVAEPYRLLNAEDQRSIAYLFTWHDHSCMEDPDMLKAVKKLKEVPYDSLEFYNVLDEHVAKLPYVERAISNFRRWFADLKIDEAYPQQSYQCEYNLNADEDGMIHHHTVISRLFIPGAAPRIWHCVKWKDWFYRGVPPDVSPNMCHGRSAARSTFHLHGYTQVCKSGTLRRQSNYQAPDKFLIQGNWIHEWWRKGKIGPEKAIEEIVTWKASNGRKLIEDIEWNENKKVELQGFKERFKVRNHLMAAFKTFRFFTPIQRWRAFYKRSHWGKASRFRFLVLVGPSKLGKTNLALSLFGVHYTYVSNAQGVSEPYLHGYSKRHHKAILLDECTPECVLANKQFFQANADGCTTGHTPSGQYVRYWWLYQVPLIICTNKWLSEAEKQVGENKWLVENSVVVEITEPCWT